MNTDHLKEFTKKHSIARAVFYPALIMRRAILKKKLDSILSKKLPWQKEILNNLSEMLVGDPIIRVDEFNGIFSVDSHSDIFTVSIINKCYEPHLANLCIKYLDKNRDIVDVGANIGFYTVMFAKNIYKKKVLSIEPTKNTLQRLRRNIELNDVIDKVEVFEGVASNRIGTVKIRVIKGKEEYSSIGEMVHPWIINENWDLEEVMCVTLDKLVQEKSLDPGFLKVDVEGVEHLVFEGAQKVLSYNRPIILSELSDFLLRKNGSSASEVINIIKKHEYDVFDPVNPENKTGSVKFGDILCFPKEMMMENNYSDLIKLQ